MSLHEDTLQEEWYTLEDITESDSQDELVCIAVDSPDKQFLAGDIGVPTHNTEEGKNEDALKGEAAMIIGSVARLGRAAGVHLVIATQRPDATLIAGETKANLHVRINAGRTDSNASSMILGNAEGTRVKSNPRGRLYIKIHGDGNHGHGFFAPGNGWMDDYLAEHGQNPDGTPLSQQRSQFVKQADFDGMAESDLDSESGINNEAVLQRMREEERRAGIAADPDSDDGDWGDIYEDDDDSPTPDFAPASTEVDDGDMERPDLNVQSNKKPMWERPEDDWDSELEDLINENFEQ